MTKMTKETMLEGGGGHDDGKCSDADWWEEWVETTCAIAPGNHAPSL
jgi:hypothetical protein